MNEKQPAEYLTKVELALMLRVSTRTITNYVGSGTIPNPVKFGRKALWSKSVLVAFIRSQDPAA